VNAAFFGAPRARFHPGHRPTSSESGWVPPGSALGALRSLVSRASRRTTASTPRGAGHSSPPGQGNRSSSEPRRPHPTGQGNRSSSEPRRPHPTGVRQTGLFGASRARFHPGQENRTSSEGRRPRLNPGQSPSPRGRAPRPPGAARRSSSEPRTARLTRQGRWSSSEPHPLGTAGQGTCSSSEPRAPQLGDKATGVLRNPVRRVSPGPGNRSSSEPRALRLTGTRQPALFGGPRVVSHRDRATGTLRRVERCVSSGSGNGSSSEPLAPSLIGVRQTALFGGPRAEPHRDQRRHSSEGRALVPPWSGKPQPHRDRAFGALRSTERSSHRDGSQPPLGQGNDTPRSIAPRLAGPGNRHSSEGRAPGSNRASRSSERDAHRGQATGALRSPSRRASPGSGRRHSSEGRAPSLTGTG
jgi:hypothetical protein